MAIERSGLRRRRHRESSENQRRAAYSTLTSLLLRDTEAFVHNHDLPTLGACGRDEHVDAVGLSDDRSEAG
jgi:hypothetical protein